jgi:hypothetical protein
MIDYKIADIKLSSQGISANIRIYEGDITTEQELVDGTMQDVTRYRRSSKLVERNIVLDTNEVIALFTKYLNKRLAQEAAQRGKTVITEQSSSTV